MLDPIHLLRGQHFQDFCDLLLSLEYEDFQAVNGAGGDGGNDGFLMSGDTVFQAYAPEKESFAKVREKIDDSIRKALVLRTTSLPQLRRLVFLTPFDWTPDMHAHLGKAAAQAALEAEPWGYKKLEVLLLKYPSVRKAFPEFLLPDVIAEVRKLQNLVPPPSRLTPLEEIFGEDFDAKPVVWQKNDGPGGGDRAAFEFFRVRAYSESLVRGPFEPEEEQVFLGAVRAAFPEDANVTLEDAFNEGVLLENRGADLAFHRRWGWWTDGFIGMAATLPDLYRRGCYSVADVAVDLVRFLVLAVRLGQRGDVRVVFDIDPCQLEVRWDASDRRARERLGATLRGVVSVPRPKQAERRRPLQLEHVGQFGRLGENAVELTSEFLRRAAKDQHGARIRRDEFTSSIRHVLSACERAMAL